jgi:hypothetical protein
VSVAAGSPPTPAPAALTSVTRLLLVLLATVGVWTVTPAVARAHGSLIVPTAVVSATGPEVRVRWSAAPDDAAAIVVGLGRLDRERYLRHLADLAALPDGADDAALIAELTAEVDERALADDPRLHAYLRQHITVAMAEPDGPACEAERVTSDAFLTDGAELTFRCPEPPGEVALTVTVLFEQDPTHRTFSRAGRGEVAIHSVATPTQVLDVSGTGTATAVLPVVLVGSVVVLGGAVASLRVVGRPSRAGRPSASPGGTEHAS